MILTEIVLMIQNELQKSYDYLRNTAMHSQADGHNNGFIHMNFSEVEIEMPLIIELRERGVSYESLQELPDVFKNMKIPFNLDFQLDQFMALKQEDPLTQLENTIKSEERSRVHKGEKKEESKFHDRRFMVGNETNVRLLSDKDIAIRTKNNCKGISTIKIKFRPVI